MPTVSASVATRCEYLWGGSQAHKFEQVSNVGHQMSLAEDLGWGSPYSEVPCPGMGLGGPCMVRSNGNGHMGPPPSCEQTDRQSDMTEIAFPQLRLQVVIKVIRKC